MNLAEREEFNASGARRLQRPGDIEHPNFPDWGTPPIPISVEYSGPTCGLNLFTPVWCELPYGHAGKHKSRWHGIVIEWGAE